MALLCECKSTSADCWEDSGLDRLGRGGLSVKTSVDYDGIDMTAL